MKVISILCAVVLTLCLRASAATLLTEGFNSATIPAGRGNANCQRSGD